MALGRVQGSSPATYLPPSASSTLGEAHRCRVRVEPDFRLFGGERLQLLVELFRLGDIGERFQPIADRVADLGRVDEQCRTARRRHDGEGERHGRVLDVAAANIEQPADGIRRGEQHGVLLVLGQRRLHVGDLLGRRRSRRIPAGGDRPARRTASAAPRPIARRSGCPSTGVSLMPAAASVLVSRSISLIVCSAGS